MDALNLQQQNYVEDMGLFFEQHGNQRSVGKLIGLLLIADEPLSQEQIMRSLSLSRTSISVALRWAEHLAFVQQISLPGDRKRYYQIQDDMADWLARSTFEEMQKFLRLLKQGERLAHPGARTRVARMGELFHFLNDHIQAALADWQARN